MNRLALLVFSTGAVTLGMELSAARLLEPAFGNNQIVWAVLIGLILLYLAVGGWLGGRLADRYPHLPYLVGVATVAAISIALIPFFSSAVLRMAATGIEDFEVALLAGSLIAVLLLFSVPGILLGTVSPWAVRLAVADVETTGQVAGRLYAIATAGSILGTFLPVLLLIPAFGTRWTFFILALALAAILTLITITTRARWIPLVGLALIVLLALVGGAGKDVRSSWDSGATGELIYEDESRYNYISVRKWGSEHHLKLNDGVGIHSVYHPDMLLSQGIWDYFLLAPFFQHEANTSETIHPQSISPQNIRPQNALLIGLAAGTVSELITDIYGPIPITGVELDPQIIAVGRQYFAMNQPNLTAVAADGRHWLAQQPADAKWEMVAIDAYRPPYIPFHLTTVEFFALVRDHMHENGVLAINVGRTDRNFALVDSLVATLGVVFPSVHIIDEPGPENTLANSLVVATVQPTTRENYVRNIAGISGEFPVEFVDFARGTTAQLRVGGAPENVRPFTDDHAPVERVVHGIVWDFMVGSP